MVRASRSRSAFRRNFRSIPPIARRTRLAKIAARSYAAIVLDIRMPEMDGIRALEEIRKIDPHVSVIMLTGYGTLLDGAAGRWSPARTNISASRPTSPS